MGAYPGATCWSISWSMAIKLSSCGCISRCHLLIYTLVYGNQTIYPWTHIPVLPINLYDGLWQSNHQNMDAFPGATHRSLSWFMAIKPSIPISRCHLLIYKLVYGNQTIYTWTHISRCHLLIYKLVYGNQTIYPWTHIPVQPVDL